MSTKISRVNKDFSLYLAILYVQTWIVIPLLQRVQLEQHSIEFQLFITGLRRPITKSVLGRLTEISLESSCFNNGATVDGRNPPADMVNIPGQLLTGFYTSQVVSRISRIDSIAKASLKFPQFPPSKKNPPCALASVEKVRSATRTCSSTHWNLQPVGPLKIGRNPERIVFQPWIFRGYVSCREVYSVYYTSKWIEGTSWMILQYGKMLTSKLLRTVSADDSCISYT